MNSFIQLGSLFAWALKLLIYGNIIPSELFWFCLFACLLCLSWLVSVCLFVHLLETGSVYLALAG